MDASVQLSWATINQAQFILHSGEHVDVSAVIGYTGSIDNRRDLVTLVFPSVLVDVGGVPIYITPSVTFFDQVTGNLVVTGSTGISQDAIWMRDLGIPTGPLHRFTALIIQAWSRLPLRAKGQSQFKAALGMELSASLFTGILSPNVSLAFFAVAIADVTQNPWWSVDAGLDGSLGVGVFHFQHGPVVGPEHLYVAADSPGVRPVPRKQQHKSLRFSLLNLYLAVRPRC